MTDWQKEAGISADDMELLARAAAWNQYPSLHDCTPIKLAEIVHKHGLEFATAVLHDRLLGHPEHGAFFQRVRTGRASAAPKPVPVGIVPGAFYREHKNTGADGARLVSIVEALKCPVEVIPVDSFGSLARNSSLIAGWLTSHSEEQVVLISLSKGSGDLKFTLALPDAARLFRNVTAWISLSGLPQGTPLVAWLRRQPLRRTGVRLLLWLRRQRYSVLEELRHEPDGPLAGWPALPANMRIIHVVAFPLRRHLAHPWATRGYERIAPFGPNDGGGFLLGEVTNLPGTVFPIWGADHYVQSAWEDTATLRAVLVEAMSQAGALRQTNQSAAQPSMPPASKSSA
jgi:hypothetical protein